MRSRLFAAMAMGAIVFAGCTDVFGPDELAGNASPEDRDEIIALLTESGFFADNFGVEGAAEDASAGAAASQAYGVAAEGHDAVAAPRRWGRRHGEPIRRLITIEVDEVEGVAYVEKQVVFDGVFLLALNEGEEADLVRKPLQETLEVNAKFVRREVDAVEADGEHRRWRLADISPAEWRMTDPEEQTVGFVRVEVWVNEELALEITDPSELFGLDTRVPHLQVGDFVTVKAYVENSLDNGNEPDTYVFLHLFHASPGVRIWIRVPMLLTDDGAWVREWEVKHSGRERIAVDAIDAQTFKTAEDDYRANIWGIPYMVEGEGDEIAP